MKKTKYLMAGLLGVAAVGFTWVQPLAGNDYSSKAVRTVDYTLDETLEPDEIPGPTLSQRLAAASRGEFPAVDGPVRATLPQSDEEDTASPQGTVAGEQRVTTPHRVRGDSVEESESPYSLVQYRSRSRSRSEDFQPAVVQTPSVQEISSMSDTERREALKVAIRKVLEANSKRQLTTQNNSPGDVLLMALPYGADARVYQPNTSADPRDRSAPKGSYIYSIGTLCWNYPCSGKTLLRNAGSRIYARVGAGYQKRPASLLALLAMSNIMPDYELKVGGNTYSIAHLVASEKASISKGMNLSMALVGLSFYCESGEKWKNEMGESWSIERMITEELNRSIDQGTSDVTDWLLGLTAAVQLYEEEGKPLRGPVALARRQLGTYHDFVLSVQNENSLWHPKFFLFKGSSPDAYETMFSSGHILRWLLLSLSDKQLKDHRVVNAVASLTSTIGRVPTNIATGTLTDRQLEGLAVSLHALSIYNQRVYGDDPVEEKKKEETEEKKEEKKEVKTATTKTPEKSAPKR